MSVHYGEIIVARIFGALSVSCYPIDMRVI